MSLEAIQLIDIMKQHTTCSIHTANVCISLPFIICPFLHFPEKTLIYTWLIMKIFICHIQKLPTLPYTLPIICNPIWYFAKGYI